MKASKFVKKLKKLIKKNGDKELYVAYMADGKVNEGRINGIESYKNDCGNEVYFVTPFKTKGF